MAGLLPVVTHHDIVWQAADDTPAVIPVPGPDGEPLDLTGWSATCVVVNNGAAVHRWSVDDGSARCGADGVTLLADDSADWAWWRGRFELLVEAPAGSPLAGTRRVVPGDMLVRARAFVAVPPTSPTPEPPRPSGTLVMRHGDSWQPPRSPRFALHQGGVALPLAQWWVRAQARMDGASRPLFSWCAHLSATEGTGVEVDTVRYRRPNPVDPSQPAVVELPAMWLRLDVDDWVGKPKEWEGFLEVELTRGSLTDPLERITIVADRPLLVVPDRIP